MPAAAMSSGILISKRLMLINTISSITERLVSVAVLVWLQPFLLNRVSEAEYGLYRMLFGLMVFVPLLTGILGGSLARFVTVAYAQDDQRRVTEITSTMFPVCLLGSAIVLVAGAPMVVFIDRILIIGKDLPPEGVATLVTEARIMLATLIGIAAFRICFMPFRLGLNIKQKFIQGHLIAFSGEVVRYGLMFALLFGVSTKVLWIVLASVPSTLIDVVVTTSMSRRLVPALRFERAAFRRELFAPILSYGWWTLLVRLVVMLRESLSLWMLNRASPLSETPTNVFGLGNMVDNQLRRNTLVMMPVLQPALTAMHATGQDERLIRTYFRFSRYLLWTFMVAAVPLVVFRDELWALYLGAGFETNREVGLVMTILLARLLVTFPQAPIMAISFARGQSRPVAVCSSIVELATAALGAYLVFVEDLGATGMAIAVLVASLIGQPLLFWPLGREITGSRFGPWLRATLIPGLVPTVLATPLWLGVWALWPPHTWRQLGVAVSVGMLGYAAAIWAFCLDASERADAAKLFARLRRKTAKR